MASVKNYFNPLSKTNTRTHFGTTKALTIHKVQALTIKNKVHGCLEGVFALGQVYVLFSRVTDPDNFHLVGIPPEDLLEDVARAWQRAGLDVDACLEAACEVTREWEYATAARNRDPAVKVAERLVPRSETERRVPPRLSPLADILNPQPGTAEVVHAVLDWINRCDAASQAGAATPPPARVDGAPLFPEHEWWLTEFEKRKATIEEPSLQQIALFEDADITRDPLETWWQGSASESSGSVGGESGNDSEGSLPAGPPVKVLRRTSPTFSKSPGETQGTTGLRRRLRGKQPPGRALGDDGNTDPRRWQAASTAEGGVQDLLHFYQNAGVCVVWLGVEKM